MELLGKYKSYGRELQITRGNLIYSNSSMTEPRLDILAEREIEDEDITVGMEITGYASNPKTRVVSNPSMTESEALSWLLFGGPLNSVSSSQADSINARAMALNAGGPMPARHIGAADRPRQSLGIRHAGLGRFHADGRQAAVSEILRQLRRIAAATSGRSSRSNTC